MSILGHGACSGNFALDLEAAYARPGWFETTEIAASCSSLQFPEERLEMRRAVLKLATVTGQARDT